MGLSILSLPRVLSLLPYDCYFVMFRNPRTGQEDLATDFAHNLAALCSPTRTPAETMPVTKLWLMVSGIHLNNNIGTSTMGGS